MDVFTNTKITKKILIILVALILFNFCCPKMVRAVDDGWDVDERIAVLAESIFFWLVDGVQNVLDNLFVGDHAEGTKPVSAENVIKGKFLIMDPNIFKQVPQTDDGTYLDWNKTKSNTDHSHIVVDARTDLRNIIASWYYAIRNLAIVALLTILVYVSIRMVLTSVSQDKAKYKVMFKDWLIALCLVFVIHYCMLGILHVTDIITNSIASTNTATFAETLASRISTQIDTCNTELAGSNESNIYSTLKKTFPDTVLYAAVVIMNIIFVVKYCIRAMILIFLTLLGPISCITYPIDKISDGKAQAYDMWFKEYLYNVIIQPFHLLTYTVLVGSAIELVEANMIYAMICFGLMIPAEKFIKQMFGFKDKLGTPLGSFAGGAMAGQLMNKVFSGGGSKARAKDSSNGEDNSSTQNELPPKTVDNDALMDGGDKTTGISDRSNLWNSRSQLDKNTGDYNTQLEANKDIEDTTPSLDENSGQELLPETGGGPSAAAAYQEYEGDPIAAAEKEALEEQLADGQLSEDELTDEQKKLLGLDNPTEIPEEGENINIDDNMPENDEQNQELQEQELQEQELQNQQLQAQQLQNQQLQAQRLQAQQRQVKPRTRVDALKASGRQIASIHNQRMAKKWGSTSRLKRMGKRTLKLGTTIGKRGGRLVASTGKTALRGAAVLTGAAALGAFGAMFGQGKAAAGAGATAGLYLSNKTISGVSNISSKAYKGASNAASDYWNGLKSDKARENTAKDKFTADKKQIDKAVYSYRKNNDGQNPNRKQLEQEVSDRFELSRYGLTDDQIEDALELYQNKNQEVLEREALNNGIDVKELQEQAIDNESGNLDKAKYRQLLEENLQNNSVEKAKNIAGSQAKYTSKLAKAYSAKDFRDPKAMENAYNAITNGLMEGRQDTPENRQMAGDYARRYLTDAASMNGVSTVALPKHESSTTAEVKAPKQQITVTPPSIVETLELGNGRLTEEQQVVAQNIHFKILEAGYDFNQSQQMARAVVNGNAEPEEIIRNYENIANASIEYIENKEARAEAEKVVRAQYQGKAPKVAVNSELRERFILKSTFNVQKEKDVSAIRDMETEHFETKTQLEMSREYARKTRGMSEAGKQREMQQLRSKLRTSGASADKIEQDIGNIVDLADIINNPEKNISASRTSTASTSSATRTRRTTRPNGTSRTTRNASSGGVTRINRATSEDRTIKTSRVDMGTTVGENKNVPNNNTQPDSSSK